MNTKRQKGISADPDIRILVTNRKARYNYEVIDTIEAGIVLVGSEVKSLRQGKVSLGDAYASIDEGEIWLHQMHVSPYDPANQFNHDPLRKRKLLLHKRQIQRIRAKAQEKGLTLIPLRVLMVKNLVKVEIGLCRGKRLYDKREATAKKDARRDMDRARREARR